MGHKSGNMSKSKGTSRQTRKKYEDDVTAEVMISLLARKEVEVRTKER